MNHRSLATLATTVLAGLLASGASAQVHHWGAYGGRSPQPVPAPIANLKNVVAIDASNSSSYALESDGSVWALGENRQGQLGNGGRRSAIKTPVQVRFPTGTKIVAIGEAENQGFAIDSTGQGWSWGELNSTLCRGRGATRSLTPQRVPGMTEALAVQGGEHHVLWLLKSGTLAACGVNKNGQLGVGKGIASSPSPIPVPGLAGIMEISAGEKSSCARSSGGVIYAWGGDVNGQVGNGLEEPSVYTPFKVALPGGASEVSCGGDLLSNGHSLALVGGVVYGWGADTNGQVGDGQTVNKTTPTVATALSSLSVTHVIAAGAFSLALSSAGNVYAWGADAHQALGTGEGRSSLVPLLVDSGAVEISATAYNSLDRTLAP
jgi:alpha-tubulin suppressor-like RCC1 family protein